MSGVDRYMTELGDALASRGRPRRRVLDECRAHLEDLASEIGEEAALQQFGLPDEIAREIDLEIATRGALRATLLSVAGVFATGGSTLALIHSANPGAHGSAPWAVAFFVFAQVSATCLAVAALEALTVRRTSGSAADLKLLARRNAYALVAAALTMFAAGGAVPGRGSALLLLTGPSVLVAAGVGVLRARAGARRLSREAEVSARPPMRDLGQLLPVRLPALGDWQLCFAVMALGAAAAYVWGLGEGATATSALAAAAIEAAAIAGCFAVLGRALGLRAADLSA